MRETIDVEEVARRLQAVTGQETLRKSLACLDVIAKKAEALQAARRTARIDWMLDKAVEAGKIPPGAKMSLAQAAQLEAFGIAWLKGYLGELPKAVYTTKDPQPPARREASLAEVRALYLLAHITGMRKKPRARAAKEIKP